MSVSSVYQTARVELSKQIARHAGVIHGHVLDVGSSHPARYRHLFECETYRTLDVLPGNGVDIVGKAEAIPLPDASADSLVCTQVLGDVYDLRAAFAEFYRVLRPGGAALVTEGFMDPLHAEPMDFWRFTSHSFRRLAEDAGFGVELIERRGGYHSVMAQMRTRYWIERLDAYNRWYRPVFSMVTRVHGTIAQWLDRRDTSRSNRLFAHGYMLIARKPHV